MSDGWNGSRPGVLVARSCVIVTLVVQGLTLAPLTALRADVPTCRRAGRLPADCRQRSAEKLSALLRRATDVERTVVLDRRRRGVVSAAVADEVLRDVETRATRDFG